MTPAEREEALERREANTAILAAKLEKDRVALESEIAASAAASKAASSINRALQADAEKKVRDLEVECGLWEAKLARVKAELGKAAPILSEMSQSRNDQELTAERAVLAAAKAQLATDRAALDRDKATFERESADSLMRAESQLSERRTKMEAQLAALVAKEVAFDERTKNSGKA